MMNFEKTTLKNGLRVVTIPMPRLKSVTAMILVGVGSRYETTERQGVAHFIEHMMFKGTEKRPTPLAIATEMDGIGAVFNAFTGRELTGFYVKAASNHFPLIMDVLTDILLNSKFGKSEIERERGAILEERRMYRDDPKDHVWDLYDRIAFDGHPLGRPIIGEERTIKATTRQHLLDFCHEWYKPGNIVVAAAGGISKRKAVDEVRNLLGDLHPTEWRKAIPFEGTKQRRPQVSLDERKTDQTHFALGVHAYPFNHPRKHAYALLDVVLGAGMSSRLFTEVREKRGLAYYVGSLSAPYTDTGAFAAYSGVNNRRAEEALRVVIDEFRRLKKELISPKELTKAKEMIKGQFALSLESSSSVAQFFAYRELLMGKIETPEELMKKIDAVTAAQVREVARELFVNETLNLAIVGPGLKADRLLPLLDLS